MDPLTATIGAAVLIGIGYGLGYYRYGRESPPVLFRIEHDEWRAELLLVRDDTLHSSPAVVTMSLEGAEQFAVRMQDAIANLKAGLPGEGSEETLL